MNITDIRVRKLITEGRLRAVVSVTINDEIAIHDIKVIQGPERLFVAMPSRREENGVFRDIVHPISVESRQYLEHNILEAYHAALEEAERDSAGDSF
ncbi:MAG: septation regulator SpoVG [Oscillospiraceae bacterium]|jgi:stage V sporulation protein G